MTTVTPQFIKSGKDYYLYNNWRKSSGQATIRTDPFLFLQNSEPYLYAYPPDFLLKVILANKGDPDAKEALRKAFEGMVTRIAQSQNSSTAFNFGTSREALWYGLPSRIATFDSGASTTKLTDPTASLQAYATNLKKTLTQQFCGTVNPAVNTPCRLVCENGCEVTQFCRDATTIAQSTIPLDADITALCSCVVSPYSAWITQELIRNAITDPSSPLNVLKDDMICFDGNQCRDNGYKTTAMQQKLNTCPTICSNTFDLQTLESPTRLQNIIQSCTVDGTSAKPMVMLFKTTVNTISRQGVAVVKQGQAPAYLTFQLSAAPTHNSLWKRDDASTPPPESWNKNLLYILIAGGVGLCLFLAALLVWWFV
jgi:hypothetical protein